MSNFKELLERLTPEGVPYRTLGEVTKKTSSIRWSEAGDNEFQYIDLSSVDRVTHKIGPTTTISANNAPSRAQQSLRTGDVIFATTRPAQLRWALITDDYDDQVASTGYCVLRPDGNQILSNYLAHILGTSDFKTYVESNQVAGNYPSIPDSKVRSFRIPVPSLEVQRQVVEILDTFMRLEAELEAELESRKKQYEFYRNRLLEPKKTWRQLTLGHIGRVEMCKRIFRDQTSSTGDIPFFKIGTFGKTPDSFIPSELFEKYKESYPYPKKGDVLLSASGTIGRRIVFDGNDAYFQDSNIIWLGHDESVVLNRFLFHWYETVGWTIQGGTIGRLYNGNFLRTQIKVPAISEQKQIVDVLDAMDALVNDLSIGLPAELNARRKQCEYYRDKLLTFKELEA